MRVCFKNGSLILSTPQLILFDKDGTLIDIHHYWGSMIRMRADLICERWFYKSIDVSERRKRIIESMGLNLETGLLRSDGPVGVKSRQIVTEEVANTVRCEGVDIGNTDIENVFQEVDRRTERNLLPLLRLLPGVTDLLGKLKLNGISVGILSTDLTNRARLAIELLGLGGYFDFIYGGDCVQRAKPAVDLVQKAIRFSQFDKRLTVMIGDHPVDIQMGINAGVMVNIGVATGLSTKKDFASYDCLVVGNLEEIDVRE